MKIGMLPGVAVGILVWVAPSVWAAGRPPAAECAPACPTKALWVEREVPVQVLVPREIITPVRKPTCEVAYREEKRVVTDMVIKSREVQKEVTCTTMKPVTVTDPCTGCCTTVLKPIAEVKTVTETAYYAVPEERTVLVRVPYLIPGEEVVPQRTILLEYRTEMQKKGYAIGVPGIEAPKARWFVAPKPCPAPEHH